MKDYNTFGVSVKARYFTEIAEVEDLPWLISLPEFKEGPHLILGGGSNILFTKDYDGLVVHNRLRGIKTDPLGMEKVRVTAGSGVIWHTLVEYCIDRGYGGIENLSLIPGTVGAAPIQNIGAYGVELKDVFVKLQALNYKTGKLESFSNVDCQFGYRDSVFKNAKKGKYFIISVTLELSQKAQTNISYGAIESTLEKKGITKPSFKDVADAVIQIRQSKLPDPKEIGNSGSFFKNPVISLADFKKLKKKFPEIPNYPQPDDQVKIPAAWLIDQCGWKGYREGDIGVHVNQPLVLVNYGDGKGADIWKLAKKIQQSVIDKFGIKLAPEVNVI